MDSREKFNAIKQTSKKCFYDKLYLEDITDEDYIHVQKVFEEFQLKSLGEYHDLYVQSDTLFLTDLFENFINKCIEIYKLELAHFFSAPGLPWQACLKKPRVKLELLTKNDRGGIEVEYVIRYIDMQKQIMSI